MTLAEKLTSKGIGGPDFTKEELVSVLEKKLSNGGYTGFVIGTHVSTNLESNFGTIGDCNPNNREYLYRWLHEEGLKYESDFNCYGVEYIKIYV